MRSAFMLMTALAWQGAPVPNISALDINGFRLGQDRSIFEKNAKQDQQAIADFNDALRAAGALQGDGTINPIADWKYGVNERGGYTASVPTPNGRVDIEFLCAELGGSAYEISQHRQFDNVSVGDIGKALTKKYGKPTFVFVGTFDNGKPDPDNLNIIWSETPVHLTPAELEHYAEDSTMYSGPGLSVKIDGLHLKNVDLHLISEDGRAKLKQCAALRAQAKNREAVSQLKF